MIFNPAEMAAEAVAQNKTVAPNLNRVVWCQQLEESERGWGVRPDGYLLALTLEDCKDCVTQSMRYQERYFQDQGIIGVPDEYTRPAGEPYECEVTQQRFDMISENGLRIFENDWPQPIGAAKVGWRKAHWEYLQGRS